MVTHVDRHFPTIKAFLTLNLHSKNNGTYVWYPGTQRVSLARIKFEYLHSVYESFRCRNKHHRIPRDWMEHGRICPSNEMRKELGLHEIHIETPENSLVISNNRGFHRRGTIQPGEVREQIRLLFHYLEEPIYIRLAWKLVGWLAKKNILPTQIRKKLDDQGIF